MNCPNCHAQIPDGSTVCPICCANIARSGGGTRPTFEQLYPDYAKQRNNPQQPSFPQQPQSYQQPQPYQQPQSPQLYQQPQSYQQPQLYQQPQPYQQPQTRPQTGFQATHRTSLMVWSILSIIFFCLPAGIYGLVKYNNASKAASQAEAEAITDHAVKVVQFWCGVVIVLWVLAVLIGM